MMTAQVPKYNSLYWDPLTCGVNALAQKDWILFNNYVNAPFSLLPKVIDTIVQQQAVATVIAPLWPGQVWFQKLQLLLMDNPSANLSKNDTQNRSSCGTVEEQRLASIRLENLWKTRLRCLGWSNRASTQSTYSLAKSTIKT